MIRRIARPEQGETSEKISTAGRRETWSWNQEVQEKLKDSYPSEKLKRYEIPSEMMQASWPVINTARKRAKREVARNKAYEKLYEKFGNKERGK